MQCRAANSEEQTFCVKCQTRLPKRYLRVVNFSDQTFESGDTLSDRFVFRGPHVVLDIRPGLLLNPDYDIPDLFLPYLKLFPYRIHYSQFFAVIWVGETEKAPILLLDNAPLIPKDLPSAPIAEEESQRITAPLASALPLFQVWQQAKPLRQLNWLWQITRLWDPFLQQGVATSLVTSPLLRVEGPILRVLELHNDKPDSPPTLADLGEMLSQFKPLTSGTFNILFSEVCDALVQGEISDTEGLSAQIEDMMVKCREEKSLSVSLATQTDPGVVRTHNEDQCFPASGSLIQNSPESLLIVCDGVGGHAGGEVASATAIEALQEHLSQVILDTLSPEQIKQELAAACCHANDLISARNDSEQRQERARMGTTLVMALVHNQQLYIAHIGDSRAYLVTKVGCYQLTVDDDIASREVRLGYLPYNEALRQPTSGSLVQALGMASSATLHPNVQRFILDDESLLLLCSDGLSDYDRVEELWQEELLPLLYRNYDLASVSQRLISLANHLNGHDNVTVGLMNLSYGNGDGSKTTTLSRPELDFRSTVPDVQTEQQKEENAWVPSEQDVSQPTTKLPKRRRQSKFPSLLVVLTTLGIITALVAGGVWALLNLRSAPTPSETPPSENDPPLTEKPLEQSNILPNQIYEISDPSGLQVSLSPLTPLVPEESPEALDQVSELPQGTLIQTVAFVSGEGSDSIGDWWEVQLCYRPDRASLVLPKEEKLWVQKNSLAESTTLQLTPDVSKFENDDCLPSSSEEEISPDTNSPLNADPAS